MMIEDKKITLNKGLILVSALSLFVITACETMSTKDHSSAEQQMREDASYIHKSYIQACVTGAGIGLVGAVFTKGQGDSLTQRAIVGATAGCAVAMGANYFLQKKRGQYASEEEKMQAVLATLREDNEKLAKLVESSQVVLAEDKRKIAEVKAAYRSREISLVEANTELGNVDENGAFLEKTLAKLEQREREWVELSNTLRHEQSEADMNEVDQEIAYLQKKIELLKDELQAMEEVRDISTIG